MSPYFSVDIGEYANADLEYYDVRRDETYEIQFADGLDPDDPNYGQSYVERPLPF